MRLRRLRANHLIETVGARGRVIPLEVALRSAQEHHEHYPDGSSDSLSQSVAIIQDVLTDELACSRFARPSTPTRTAVAMSFIEARIRRIEEMAMLAMGKGFRASAVDCRYIASRLIDTLSDRLQVRRVHTVLDAAKVINLQPHRDWPFEQEMRCTMGGDKSSIEEELAITIGSPRRSPEPMPISIVPLYLGKKAHLIIVIRRHLVGLLHVKHLFYFTPLEVSPHG